MSVLVDENLPRRLAEELRVWLPGAMHVSELGLSSASDSSVREEAERRGLVVMSKDADFPALSLIARSMTPEGSLRVIHLQIGNRTTARTIEIVQQNRSVIEEFLAAATRSTLIIRP